MKSNSRAISPFNVERLEPRTLLAWGAAGQLIGQDEAARLFPSTTGKGVAIAFIDTGIDYNHPGLGGGFGPGHKVVGGWDFVDNDGDPLDTNGHGTLVAGMAAAAPFDFNGLQYSGIAPEANLVSLRVNGTSGASDARIESALDWVITNHESYNIRVVSISLGSGNYTSNHVNPTTSDELQQLADLGILVVAASGNSGDTPAGNSGIAFPAADANVVSVGSVDASDNISGFTQRGRLLDLLAPGDGVATTTLGGGHTTVGGTSFAAPVIAGAAALVWQHDPDLSDGEVVSILRTSGSTNHDGDTESGLTTNLNYSRVNVHYALRLADRRRTSPQQLIGKSAGMSDIAYDDQGVLYLAYYDTAAHSIRFATRGINGQWSKVQSVDASGDDVGSYLSIAIDRTGKPGISYFDATNADLKYAHFDGAGWDVVSLDRSKHVGSFSSLAYDAEGDPVIAYFRKSGADLRMYSLDSSGTWTRTDVDSAGDVGAWCDISITDSGILAIAYADDTNGDLKYARLLSGQWTLFTVDDLGGVAYVDVDLHNEQAFISYQDLVNGDLKFARRQDATWQTETVYTPGNTGSFTTLLWDSLDRTHIAFWSKSKQSVYEAIGTFGSWRNQLLTDGGLWLTGANTADQEILTWVSLAPNRTSLQFGDLK